MHIIKATDYLKLTSLSDADGINGKTKKNIENTF